MADGYKDNKTNRGWAMMVKPLIRRRTDQTSNEEEKVDREPRLDPDNFLPLNPKTMQRIKRKSQDI